jgi:hypothetical protein
MSKIWNRFNEKDIPAQFRQKYQSMPTISISTDGILKLLEKLNPQKAAGPDKIKPLV